MGNYISKIQRPDGTVTNIKSYKTESIPMGKVASTSTSTAFTATIDGITELRDGVCVWLTNGVVNSATNFTININGLGAKPVYRSMNAATRESTRFTKDYTIFLIYNETRVSGGCWDYVYGFDSNTTYTNMTQTEASAGTSTTGRVIGAKVLSDTIEEHTAEINAVLPELVDEGVKNLLPNTATSQIINGITFTVYPDGTIDAYGTATANASIAIYATDYDIINKNLVASGCPSGGSATKYRCFVQKLSGNTYTTVATMTGDAVDFTLDTAQYRYLITVYNGYGVEHVVFKPMICSKADWDISQEYVPYALSNPELTAATIETVNNGAKNELCFDSIGMILIEGRQYTCGKQYSANGVTFTLNADNTITATRTESSNYDSACILMYNGRPAIVDSFFDAAHMLSGCPAGGTANTYSIGISIEAVGPGSDVYELGDGLFLPPEWESAWNNMFVILRYSSSYSGTITYKPMICTFHQWDISKEYVPYALPNPELTAAAIEAVDNGPKNLLKITASSATINGITFVVNTDGTVVANGLATANATFFLATSSTYNLPEGDYILSGCTGGSATTYDLRFHQSSTPVNYDGGTEITVGSGDWNYAILIRSGQSVIDLVFKPMICTKTDWDVSQEYVPYIPSNSELLTATAKLIDEGAKNIFNINSIDTSGSYHHSYSMTSNALIVSSTGNYGRLSCMMNLAAGSYTFSCKISDVTIAGGSSEIRIASDGSGSSTIVKQTYTAAGNLSMRFELAQDSAVFIMFYVNMNSGNYANSAKFSDIMLCAESEYNISQEYVPYALPNPELTAAAIEMIDSGTKNLLNHTAYTRTVNKVTYTVNADRSITITSAGDNTQSTLYLIQNYTGFQAGTYVLSGVKGTSSSGDTYAMWLKIGTASSVSVPKAGLEFDYDGTSALTISIIVRASQTVNATFKPMLCTKADWGISQEYQPYRPEKVTLEQAYSDGTLIATNANLNDYTTAGLYYATVAVAPTLTNAPYTATGFRLVVEKNSSSGAAIFQTLIPTSQTNVSMMYKRVYENNGWGSWLKFNAALDVIPSGTTLQAFADSLPLGAHHCFYNSANNASDAPVNAHAVVDVHKYSSTTGDITFNPISTTYHNKAYRKILSSGTWRTWQEFVGGTARLTLGNNANLNDYTYACEVVSPSGAVSATIQNTPWTASGFSVKTINFINDTALFQFLLPNTTTGKWYRRKYGSGTWTNWIEFDAASYLITGASAIASNTDMNTLKTPGVYTCASYSIANSLTNCAYKSSGFRCDVIQTSDTNCIRQIIQPNQLTTTGGNARYERSCVISSNTWSSWYKFEGTKIT